jgi:outer membrane protein TolC
MFQRCDFSQLFRTGWRQRSVALAAWLLVSGVAAAQDPPSTTSRPAPSIPAAIGTPLKLAFPLVPSVTQNDALPRVFDLGEKGSGQAFTQYPGDAPAGVRRITLQQAQQLAAGAANPLLVRLGQLQVEAAKQHRLGVNSLYFPNVSGQFENLHLNQHPGEVFTVQRPFAGTFLSVPVNIIEQNQTAVNFAVIQPITPLFAVRQLVTIARADENIARAKAGMPPAQRASLVEKNYYDLLIAERELISAGAEAKNVQAKWVTASNAAVTRISTEQQTETIGAAKSLLFAASKVKELTASLNEILGLPAATRLELVPPEPLVENLSLNDATADAAATAEIYEAEQTAVKAHAGSKLAKMEYFPSLAVIGGYTHQTAINVVLPDNFAYIGFMATYTLFDSFKRERAVKEAVAQAEMADLGVQLAREKAVAAVKTSYFELERSREVYRLARRMVSAARVVEARYVSENQEVDSAQAKMEVELFRAELAYRQAYARVKSLIGTQPQP